MPNLGLSRCALMAFATLATSSWPAFCLAQTEEEIIAVQLQDIFDLFQPQNPVAVEPRGYVVIDDVINNRSQPYNSGVPVSIYPDLSRTQIGYAKLAPKKSNNSLKAGGYSGPIALEEGTIQEFAIDLVTAGFNRAGYAVIDSDHEYAAIAPHVEIEISSLWTWSSVNEVDNKYVISFDMAVMLSGDETPFADVGLVQATGILRGEWPNRPSSYRNTAVEMTYSFLDNFANAVHRSVTISNRRSAAE